MLFALENVIVNRPWSRECASADSGAKRIMIHNELDRYIVMPTRTGNDASTTATLLFCSERSEAEVCTSSLC